MKPNGILKLVLGLILVVSIGFISHDIIAQQKQNSTLNEEIDLNITISNETSENELTEIKDMLKENGIDSEFSNIERNDQGELLGIQIKLSSNGNQTVVSSMSNNTGVGEISFGRKNGQLYISQDGINHNNFAFFNFPGVSSFQFDNDSIMKQHFKSFGNLNLNDMFGDEEDSFWFGNTDNASIQELLDKMRNQIGNQAKFRFIDDPNTEKLIMIDGKESDFETLNRLSEENKITSIDYLKSATAKSLYGDKGKDGAVIATTKE